MNGVIQSAKVNLSTPGNSRWWWLPLPVSCTGFCVTSIWLLGREDGLAFLGWWLILLAIGLMFWPLAQRIFHTADHNLSYLPAKAAGLCVLGLLHWTGGHLLKIGLSVPSILILFMALALVIWGGAWVRGDRWSFGLPGSRFAAEALDNPRRNWRQVIGHATFAEAGFAALLLAGTFARSLKPDLDSLEKFMNVAFINSILRSDGLPAADPWFAGSSINYYYFGHYIYALLTRLSGLKTAVAYNLCMASLWAFAGSLSFVLGAQLVRLARQASNAASPDPIFLPGIGGALTWFLVTIAGNGQAFFYSEQGPGKSFLKWLAAHDFLVGDLSKPYWFADAARFIGYNPDTTDKTIHEFPFYSFLVADLHAHVIDLTFVLLLLILLTGLISQTGTGTKPYPELVAVSLLLAVFRMANYWDFVIYLPLVLLGILGYNLVQAGLPANRSLFFAVIRRTILQGSGCVVLSLLVSWPFDARFQPMSSRVALSVAHSPLFQLSILWGAPVLAGLLWIIALAFQPRVNGIGPYGVNVRRWLGTDWIAALLFAYALALIVAPELVYVVDIYGGDYKRANTMFKLTYQAFVLLGLVWSYGICRLIAMPGKGRITKGRLIAGLMIVLMLIPAWYPLIAVRQWLGPFTLANRKGLDGLKPLGAKNSAQIAGEAGQELADDLAAIAWLNEEEAGQLVVLEAAGHSYTDANRISTFTGLPTVIGWETHEWLWRTSSATPDAYSAAIVPRQNDVRTIYTTTDQALRRELIARYQIRYVVIGSIERTEYGDQVQDDLLTALGDVVFLRPTLQLIRIRN